VDDTVEWLRDRPYYSGQIADRRRLPARDPEFADIELDNRVESSLSARGIDDLYRHQAEAIEGIRDGDDVVLATETASGKSVAYTVPAFERALSGGGRTLYVGPQNALIADQEETLTDLSRGLGPSKVSVAQYTGRQSQSEKRRVRDEKPTLILSNPDMLHYGLLPYGYRLWEWLFSSLELVVVDEVHSYRGVFGSGVGLVFRRLARLCERFDADPQFICCSATIGNPVKHAARVTGRQADDYRLVDTDTSGRGPRHWLVWNPPEYETDRGGESGRRRSSHTETKRLFVDLVTRGHQTLAFTRARQAAEQYATESSGELRDRGERGLADKIGAYQAALQNDRRRRLEDQLYGGDLRGVWSTNALELGVDVGGLDSVLLDSYPGTRMSTFQQAGRAGRGRDPALVTMIAGEDQLDQYMARNPDELFDGDAEDAIIDPENERLLKAHIACAADENWLSRDDRRHFGDRFPEMVADLETDGRLERRETAQGIRWTYDGDESAQQNLSLRTASDRDVDLVTRSSNDVIASLDLGDALRDAHPGAIYHQQGSTYEVVDLDLDRDVAQLQSSWADYYTQVLTDKAMEINETLDRRELSSRPDVTVRFVDVTVTEQISGYQRKDRKSGDTLGRATLDLPETTLRTRALVFPVPEDIEFQMRQLGGDDGFNGGIHAAEHGIISLFPLHLLCDRGDVGGLSIPYYGPLDGPAIFIYDGHPGGVGLTRRGFDRIEELFAETGDMIDACPCEDGCPSCVQSPHCGNANDPLAKAPAVMLLEKLLATAD
jgi:Distinct helicase family with a unique C-terminal domain including a metal-binding cysteine cluster